MSDPSEQARGGYPALADALTRLDAASVEAVAQRVVELMREPAVATSARSLHLVDARRLAAELGVKRSWVYAHRDKLKHTRLGDGSKGRLRFDLEAARREFGTESTPLAPGQSTDAPKRATRRRRTPRQASSAGAVLAVRETRR